MATGHNPADDKDVPPAKEPAATPLISAEQIPVSDCPLVHIGEQRYHPLAERAEQIAVSSDYEVDNCVKGLLGEDATAHHLGIENRLDTQVYADGGDGGFDLPYRGATIDVKTVGRHRHDPALTVDAYEPLTADYYVLASRVGKMNCRLIGYAPRKFVANAPTWSHDGDRYRVVDQQYLFPIPRF